MNDTNKTLRTLMALTTLCLGACDLEPTAMDEFRSSGVDADVVSMGVADGESWVLLSDGVVKGWGKRHCDSQGCLAPVDNEPLALDEAAQEVHGNGEQLVIRQADGTVLAYGEDIGQGPTLLSFGGVVAELALGEDFVCARLDDGSAACQGLPGVMDPAWLSAFVSPVDAVELSAGARHACARRSGGQVTCWGADDLGQLGVASSSGGVALAGPAQSIAAGGDHTCALLDDGSVQCWGANDEDQLGHAGPGVGNVPLGESVASIAAGAEHSCAIGAGSGALYCWGSDALGQLGGGTDTSEGIRRVDLGGQRATAVFAGPTAWTTFAVLDHGGLRGWGHDDRGQTGYGTELHGSSSGQGSMNPGNLDDITIVIATND